MKKRSRFLIFLSLSLLAITLASSLLPSGLAMAESVNSSAECMVLMESSTGRILYEKNANKSRPIASTTKILTAITVIENTANLDEICKVPAAAVGVEGSSIYLEVDEELSVRDLLYGLMLQSGNDCAEALAILTAKTKTNFAELMNKTAKKIGAKNSNFVTPHGLHDANHYSTAYDLALISSYALKNKDFAQIVKTKKHTTTWKGRDYNRVIINKNKLLNSFEDCDGVKTGYTKKAGRCYVSSATRNGMQVVCAVLNCGPMFEECANFMNKAFDEYKMIKVLSAIESLSDVKVKDGKHDTVKVGVLKDFYYPIKSSEINKIQIEPISAYEVTPPMKSGTEIGKIKISLQNELLFEEKLYTIEDVQSRSIIDRLKDLASGWNK